MSIIDIYYSLQSFWYIYLIIGVIIGFMSWLHATFVRVSKGVNLIGKLVEKFEPNHGTSIYDILTRIENKVDMLEFTKFAHLDVSDVAIFLADNNGKCMWANKSFLSLTHTNLNEIVGSGWENLIHEDDKNRVVHNWYQACKELRPFVMNFRLVNSQNDSSVIVKCEAYGKENVGYFGFLKKIKKLESSVHE